MLRLSRALAIATLVLFSGVWTATADAAIILTFEGLQNFEPVNSFYSGGTGGFGSTGPNFGIDFTTNSLACIDADAGGGCNIGGEPSPSTALFFLSGTAIMNVPAGFDTGFSFFYSAVNNPGSVSVYDGLNATGNLLATLLLPTTPSDGGDPNGAFSPFFPIGIGFLGTAMSVDFGGTVNQIAFDDVTIGSITPGPTAPEPASLLLLGIGAAVTGLRSAQRRRQRAQ